jgi:hypothetical protein
MALFVRKRAASPNRETPVPVKKARSTVQHLYVPTGLTPKDGSPLGVWVHECSDAQRALSIRARIRTLSADWLDDMVDATAACLLIEALTAKQWESEDDPSSRAFKAFEEFGPTQPGVVETWRNIHGGDGPFESVTTFFCQ